jgi:hypothetical protein
MAWFDYVNSAGIIGALGLSALQTRRLVLDARGRDVDRRTERALEFYRDLVIEGDTAEALNRMSVRLRVEGHQRFGGHTWYCLTDEDFAEGRLLGNSTVALDTPFQDLYRILFFFERVESSLHYNLVDSDVLFRSVGFHIWWWAQLLWEVKSPKASVSLHALAPQVQSWAQEESSSHTSSPADSSLLALWRSRCMTDFDGSGPRDLRLGTA